MNAPASAPAPATSVVSLLSDLDLIGRDRPVSEADLAAFERREKAFDWAHLGTTDMEIGRLCEVLKSAPDLLAPRSGHLGNWTDIAAGRAGLLDYNKAICVERGLGYALVHFFNQTEDDVMAQGDWIYLPGSSVDRGTRTPLDLYTWDGADFVPRDRSETYLSPFVLTPVDDALVPLSRLHWERMTALDGFGFRSVADVIWEQRDLVRALLIESVKAAPGHRNPPAALATVFGGAVTLSGGRARRAIQFEGEGFTVGDTYYPSVEAMVDASMLVVEAAVDPDTFFGRIKELPTDLPIMGNLITALLFALLDTHYPPGAGSARRSDLRSPCNPHVHWGAIGMAGYPPRKRGYFTQRTAHKAVRELYEAVLPAFPELDPVLYVLLPASMFTICPSDAFPADVEIIERLIKGVRARSDRFRGNPAASLAAIDEAVAEWWEADGHNLSHYYVNKFSNRRSVLLPGELPESSVTVEPEGFATLTCRQASMIVGSLTELLQGAADKESG